MHRSIHITAYLPAAAKGFQFPHRASICMQKSALPSAQAHSHAYKPVAFSVHLWHLAFTFTFSVHLFAGCVQQKSPSALLIQTCMAADYPLWKTLEYPEIVLTHLRKRVDVQHRRRIHLHLHPYTPAALPSCDWGGIGTQWPAVTRKSVGLARSMYVRCIV